MAQRPFLLVTSLIHGLGCGPITGGSICRGGFRAIDVCTDVLAVAGGVLPRASGSDAVVSVQPTVEVE